jgi:CRISPR-associated endonuclease Csn1
MKILGLDLGVASIGWALIEETKAGKKILGLGSRIIPYTDTEDQDFVKGIGISKNQKRTTKRTQRKGYDRYQLRRSNLKGFLIKQDMLPGEDLMSLPKLELWGLRAKASNKKISPTELGRVLLHLNQKRGYKNSRGDANPEKKDTDYVAEVKNRHQQLKESGKTIGQHFYNELSNDSHFPVKQKIFPREAYIEEFEAIIQNQKNHWPKILTEENIERLRDKIIYYQRKLKSQKGLVSVCEFEGFWATKTESGKAKKVGPKVAPRSSPIFQVSKIWESINSIALKNKRNETFPIPLEKKQELFNYLDNNKQLTEKRLFDILGVSRQEWRGNEQTKKGIQGNLTKSELLNYLDQESSLLQLNIDVDSLDGETHLIDRKSGEILDTQLKQIASPTLETQPLYRLWHTVYSIADEQECARALQKNFNLVPEVAQGLAKIDFSKSGFSNKSVKAMRKMLPYLMKGYLYSEAASYGGYKHSNSYTKDELLKKQLLQTLPALQKNSLRQPIVEKILNQMINLVNAILDEKQGWITKEEREKNQFEIRIELARELKQSKEERGDATKAINDKDKQNKDIANTIEKYGLKATRSRIIKYRLFMEIDGDSKKVNGTCVYCGKNFGLTDALSGNSIDVEHIIPKSKLFDDSQANKTLSHRSCNEAKGDRTAYDFMKSKSEDEFQQYLERVNSIRGKGKQNRLLASFDEYVERKKLKKETETDKRLWERFIDRQLRESQYIARKSKEILEQISYNVWSTSGGVTAYLRDKWGWNDVTMNLQLPRYRQYGQTELKEWETTDGQKHKKEIIKGWTKRDDHRHHAIDALVVACTQQGFIQRLNTLNAQHTRDEMLDEVHDYKDKLSLLDNYIVAKRPFTTQQVEAEVSKILISFKPGKKVATIGKRKVKKDGKKKVIQTGIVVPRGALSEEFVYGKITSIEKGQKPKFLFENPHLIFKPYIKELVQVRLALHNGDTKKALASLKKEPIYLDESKSKILDYATCYTQESVIKYKIQDITLKDLPFIVDGRVREILKSRLGKFGNKEKEAFKNLENDPVWFNEEKGIQIKSVRIFTKRTATEPVKKDEQGKVIGYVNPGNNHHIAFYLDETGKKVEHICTFWHAVERKKFKLPVVIKNPKEVWSMILHNKGKQEKYSQSFLTKLPGDNWTYVESLQQNEMFVFNKPVDELTELIKKKNLEVISQNLYLVWSISKSDYWFRHHLETKNSDLKGFEDAKESGRYFRFKSVSAFEKNIPTKVLVNYLGQISFSTTKL